VYCGYYSNFKKSAQSKHFPNGRKFAQFGHPDVHALNAYLANLIYLFPNRGNIFKDRRRKSAKMGSDLIPVSITGTNVIIQKIFSPKNQ
jgi:hypothetical protein